MGAGWDFGQGTSCFGTWLLLGLVCFVHFGGVSGSEVDFGSGGVWGYFYTLLGHVDWGFGGMGGLFFSLMEFYEGWMEVGWKGILPFDGLVFLCAYC